MSRVRVRVCVHGGWGGWGGGAGVSRRACVWGGLVCLGMRGGEGELMLVLRFNTMSWICVRIWLGTVSRCQAFYSYEFIEFRGVGCGHLNWETRVDSRSVFRTTRSVPPGSPHSQQRPAVTTLLHTCYLFFDTGEEGAWRAITRSGATLKSLQA